MNLYTQFVVTIDSPGGVYDASLDQPNIPLTDTDAFRDAFGGGTASSGETINVETALTYAALWRGIRLISRDVAKLPLITYRNLKGGGKERDNTHPAYYLLRRKPNEEMTAFIFRKLLQSHALLRGNGYAYIYRLGNGRPESLVPLSPDSTFPVRENGRLLYVTTFVHLGERIQRKLLPENVLHIRGLSSDGLAGYSLIDKAKETLGLGLAARKYGAIFFKNNARPAIVLEAPAGYPKGAFQRLSSEWSKLQGGLENAHRTAVLEEGVKANVIGTDAEKSQLIETRKFEIREVANWLGVPPHKLGDDAKTSFASLEEENQSYLDDALDGWLANWEAECIDKLLSEQEKRNETHTVEFLRSALVRANLKSRNESYSIAITGGWMTRNEARAKENMNPLEGLDEPLQQMNMTPAGGDDAEDAEAFDRDNALRAHRQLIVSAVGRMAKRLAMQAKRHSNSPEEFLAWIDEKLPDNEPVIREAIGEAVDACCSIVDADVDAETTIMVHCLLHDFEMLARSIPHADVKASVASAVDEIQKLHGEEAADLLISKLIRYKERTDEDT